MGFTGEDYHRVFEEACRDLAYEHDQDTVRGKLLTIEWILWEAIRSVFSLLSMALSGMIVLSVTYLIFPAAGRSWGGLLIFFIGFAGLSSLFYGVCRAVFYLEFAINVRGRKFGDPFSR